MILAINDDLQLSMISQTDREFHNCARVLIKRHTTAIYVVFYDPANADQMRKARSIGLSQIVCFPRTTTDGPYVDMLSKCLEIQNMVDGEDELNEAAIIAILTTKPHADPNNYINLPVYYSACIPRHERIHDIFTAAHKQLNNRNLRLGVYPRQIEFVSDAIKHFGDLSKVPESVWSIIPSIGNCYFAMFKWFYFDGARSSTVNNCWNAIFLKSFPDINNNVDDWIDDIAELLETQTPTYTAMYDLEWNMIVGMLIDYGKMSVTKMEQFGKATQGRSIPRRAHPTYPLVYAAAHETLGL